MRYTALICLNVAVLAGDAVVAADVVPLIDVTGLLKRYYMLRGRLRLGLELLGIAGRSLAFGLA